MKLTNTELKELDNALATLPEKDPAILEGFACSASDTSCGCGWDCSSTNT